MGYDALSMFRMSDMVVMDSPVLCAENRTDWSGSDFDGVQRNSRRVGLVVVELTSTADAGRPVTPTAALSSGNSSVPTT